MSYAAVEQDDTEDRFYTQVDEGDVRLFTLDQLDAAFNAGLIHENTYVCREGDSTWLTLAEVAGLGDEPAEPEPAPISVVAPIPQRGGIAASPSVIPSAPYSVAAVVMPPSIAPVVNNLSLDDIDEDMFAKPKKRHAGKVVAGLAVAGLAALGFVVVSSGGVRLPKLNVGGNASQASAASLSLASLDNKPVSKAAPVEEASKPSAVAETPKPAETATDSQTSDKGGADASAQSEKKSDDRFSDEMKAALLAKDKKQAALSPKKAKKTGRAPSVPASKRKASAGGFKASGSAYDPLNGKL